ncbi:MAG: GntR family transcriptional regulator [Microbacteriaceae bacterium]|nr:MAG: GntR family transcriptional regulator [Microbacteriaceae bacterium]
MSASPPMGAGRATTGSGKGRALRYQRVYDLVLQIIDENDLREGDKLPSTSELAQQAGVSVISVRRALDELAHVGRIVRHQGVGTFVAPQRIVSEPARPGALLETMSGTDADTVLTTELLGVAVGLPSANHAEALGIEAGQPVWEISRLRVLGSVPKVLERAVLPLSAVPAIDEDYLAGGGSLYGYLKEHYGLSDDFVEQSLEVDHPNSWEREQLAVKASDTVVRIRGVSFAPGGVAFDCYQQTYPAHEFVFYTAGTGSPKLLRPSGGGGWSIKPLGASRAG